MKKDQLIRLIESFAQLTKKKTFFLLLFFLLLFLPGENFYERLRLEIKKPLIREAGINLPQLLSYPVNVKGAKTLFLTAKSVMVIDVPSKVVMFAKNPNFRLLPASTTKIMTALIVLDSYQLDDVLTVPNLDNLLGRNMGLFEGERISVESLLYGLLVHSANDAALTLASNYPLGMEKFIEAMNQKAFDLGLSNTHFTGISGLDRPDHYSTVRDLAHLAAYAMENPVFASMVATPEILVSDVSQQHEHRLENTNELIGKVSGLKGVKTGWTERAGECLIAYVERDGKKIITVLLGSQDRFGETEKLIEWVFANYDWQEITLSTQD